MSSQEKKDLERQFTHAFLKTIKNSDQYNLDDHEEPDFILNESGRIGIEVTQVFTETINSENPRIKIEGGWDDVLELAHTIWISTSRPNVDLRIMFNDSIHIGKNGKPIIAKELVKLVDQYLPELDESFWSSDDIIELPRGSVEFHIHRYSGMEISSWRFNDVAWTPNLSSRLLQNTITKKEKRRNIYLESCEKIWLLMVLYGRRPSGSFIIPDTISKVKYHFDFDKVYLFNAFPARTWELENEITS